MVYCLVQESFDGGISHETDSRNVGTEPLNRGLAARCDSDGDLNDHIVGRAWIFFCRWLQRIPFKETASPSQTSSKPIALPQ